MQNPEADAVPWYRQPWPWFLIALPAAAVIGSIVTVVLAIVSADGVVPDYYERGLRAKQTLRPDATKVSPEDRSESSRPQ